MFFIVLITIFPLSCLFKRMSKLIIIKICVDAFSFSTVILLTFATITIKLFTATNISPFMYFFRVNFIFTFFVFLLPSFSDTFHCYCCNFSFFLFSIFFFYSVTVHVFLLIVSTIVSSNKRSLVAIASVELTAICSNFNHPLWFYRRHQRYSSLNRIRSSGIFVCSVSFFFFFFLLLFY